MGQYETSARTFQFQVTDGKRLKELVDGLCCDDDDVVLDMEEADGKMLCRLRAHGCIEADGDSEVYSDYDPDDYDHRLMPFVYELQQILPEGEGFVYIEAYFDGTAEVGSFAIIASKYAVKTFDLEAHCTDELNRLTGHPTMPKIWACQQLRIPVADIPIGALQELTGALSPVVPPVAICEMIPETTRIWSKSLYVWLDCPGTHAYICPRCRVQDVKLYPGTNILPAPLRRELEDDTDAVWLNMDGYDVEWCNTMVAVETHVGQLAQVSAKNKTLGLDTVRTLSLDRYIRAVMMKWLHANGVK